MRDFTEFVYFCSYISIMTQ